MEKDKGVILRLYPQIHIPLPRQWNTSSHLDVFRLKALHEDKREIGRARPSPADKPTQF